MNKKELGGKYSIFYLIKGKAGRYNQKLIKEVGPKFGEDYLIKNPLPSHITIKYPFETENIKKVEGVLREFVNNHKFSKLKIYGFGNFKQSVIFMKTKFSKPALQIQKELIKEFKKIGIKPRKFDKNLKPHVTVAYGNTKKTFKLIWNYVRELNKPKFELELNNLAIMKKTKNKWKIHKEFKL